jgi:hypothetical protein
LLDSDEEDQ